jgi:hypothetical protein
LPTKPLALFLDCLIDLLLTDFFDLLLFANSVIVTLHIILRGIHKFLHLR